MVRIVTMLLIFSWGVMAQPTTVPAFTLEQSDLALSRLAQPWTYFDKVGRRFAVLGYESGQFEAWAYPLKLIRNCELSFLIGSSTEAIRAKDIVRTIMVTPEATTLTYTFQSFTIRAIFITPIDEPGAFVLLDVNSTEPLTIVCSFLPVLQPMWPAGIGGQYAAWDRTVNAYLISEPTRRNHGFIGSPAAVGISYTPAHMLSDSPNQFKIEIKNPDTLKGKFIPIVMAGGKGNRDSIKAIYTMLAANPEKFYRTNLDYYRQLRASTLQVQTPVAKLNLAFEWAKVAYDNLFVDNPDLGFGMIAGLGASGSGGRPGFGWFFGGDAFINAFSLDSYGAFQSVHDALAFTQKWQRADGKMAHELSQAAAYINWWTDYPYGYIHGDTSPFYICAMADYFRMTADTEFVKRSWPSLRKAYDWSLATDENGDGLMDNKKAGLGALEYGPLTNIQSDIYTGAVWVRAAAGMPLLARAAGDTVFALEAETYATKAMKSFNEEFWDEKNEQYSYAFTAKGRHVDIVSPWSSVGLMWELGDPLRSLKSLTKLNSAELTTDWGIRSISNKSKYYEPLNYNYGAVWPFLTSWVATAQFKHHFALQGYNSLMTSVNHTFDNGLGTVTEVFSGSNNMWPQEAVSHQGFCTAGVVLPLVRGLCGLEGNAVDKRITFAPHFPGDWDRVFLANYHVGKATFAFEYTRAKTLLRTKIKQVNGDDYTIRFAPSLGAGSLITKVRVDGKDVPFRLIMSSQSLHPFIELKPTAETTVEVEFVPTVELLPPPLLAQTGETNKGLKIISTALKDKQMKVVADGLEGTTYDLSVINDDAIASVSGCEQHGNRLVVSFPQDKEGEFVRKEFFITIK